MEASRSCGQTQKGRAFLLLFSPHFSSWNVINTGLNFKGLRSSILSERRVGGYSSAIFEEFDSLECPSK
jgi:hypothetical protein